MNGQESRSGGGKRERDDPPTLSTSGPKVPKTLSNDDPDGHTVLLWPENSTGSVQFPLDDAWLLFYNYSPYIGEEKEKFASDAEREKIQVPCTEEVWVWLRNYVAAETRAANALPDASGSSPFCVDVFCRCRTIARAGIHCALVATRHYRCRCFDRWLHAQASSCGKFSTWHCS